MIKIVRNDGKILEYREPICVHRIISQFPGHSLSHNNTYLLPDAKLFSGRLYYLLPTIRNKKKTKKVTFANPEAEDNQNLLREDDDDYTGESNSNKIAGDDNKNVSVVRMKIIVHKQELEKLLEGGSVHEMIYQTLEKQLVVNDDSDVDCNSGWRPCLDTIPEAESLRRT